MQALEPTIYPDHRDGDDHAGLEQQIRQLQERLAFYEGFDLLIQDNVTHARELFRQASQEREAAAADAERIQREADRREATLRSELVTIAADLSNLAAAVDALSQRVSRALGEPANGRLPAAVLDAALPVAIVVHGVASARTALSLQRFVGTLPQVTDVAAREFAGGVLRLDARVNQRLQADQFGGWDGARHIEVLTERLDVVEFALREAVAADAGG